MTEHFKKYHPLIDTSDPDSLAQYLPDPNAVPADLQVPQAIPVFEPVPVRAPKRTLSMLDYVDRPLTEPELKRARRQQALAVVMGALPYQSQWSPFYLAFLRCARHIINKFSLVFPPEHCAVIIDHSLATVWIQKSTTSSARWRTRSKVCCSVKCWSPSGLMGGRIRTRCRCWGWCCKPHLALHSSILWR